MKYQTLSRQVIRPHMELASPPDRRLQGIRVDGKLQLKVNGKFEIVTTHAIISPIINSIWGRIITYY